MKAIVIGLGIQGKKRQHHAGSDYVCSVDPVKSEADYCDINEVSLNQYDAALVCLPDEPKYQVLKYLLENGKHVLVEKPLWTESDEQILELQDIAHRNNLVCYTAYNHRFEPHFIRMKELLDSGVLGSIRYCRMFYGNGTARLVRDSAWRDQGAGVLPDLGSHLLDTSNFWFGNQPKHFEIVTMNNFENQAPDHTVIMNKKASPQLMFEMSLLSWRNHFVCEMVGEKGSAFIESLCKWGPSRFTYQERILPSGRPPEESVTLVQDDPTWALEYAHFKNLIANGVPTNLMTDLWIQQELNQLSERYFKAIASHAERQSEINL
ncbi:MAG: Gfo/Idh/MocA family oxidoreductase [Legionellaceae bacterium]|nr:Gfo/Idh/MocA family oxidoreductase [Legionellaceae bacterium]